MHRKQSEINFHYGYSLRVFFVKQWPPVRIDAGSKEFRVGLDGGVKNRCFLLVIARKLVKKLQLLSITRRFPLIIQTEIERAH
jgi:hypothetical protein